MGGVHGMYEKDIFDVCESVSFVVRCFTIEQPFGDMFAELICFLHLYQNFFALFCERQEYIYFSSILL